MSDRVGDWCEGKRPGLPTRKKDTEAKIKLFVAAGVGVECVRDVAEHIQQEERHHLGLAVPRGLCRREAAAAEDPRKHADQQLRQEVRGQWGGFGVLQLELEASATPSPGPAGQQVGEVRPA